METLIGVIVVIAIVIYSYIYVVIHYTKADTQIRLELLKEINDIRTRTLRLENPPKFHPGEKVIINSWGVELPAVVVKSWYDGVDTVPTYQCKQESGFVEVVYGNNVSECFDNSKSIPCSGPVKTKKTSKKK